MGLWSALEFGFEVGLGMCGGLNTALAQEESQSDTKTLPRVVVTGSQIPRTDAETALPVQIIRREDIERSGATSVEEVIGRITANFGNVNLAMGAGDDVSPGFSGVSLRGFGSRATLVLLNGRRISNYAFSDDRGIGADLGVIPLAAIDRVEVLIDGASAIYGGDAVAGVVNFILRKDFQGAQADVQRFQPQARGGGARESQTVTLGIGNALTDGFNVFALIDHQRDQALASKDRAYASTGYRPELNIDSTSQTSFPANIVLPGGERFANPAAPGCTNLTVFKLGGCFFNFTKLVDILPSSDKLGALLRGSLALPNDAEAFAELLWSRQTTHYAISPTPINAAFYSLFPALVVREGSPFYPTGLGLTGDIVNPLYRLMPLGLRRDDVTTEAWRALVGWRAAIAGWNLDTALMQSTGRTTHNYAGGYTDLQKLSDAFGTGLINPFGDSGPAGNALLKSTEIRGPARIGRGTTRSADIRASRDLAQWTNGALTLGIGAEVRREEMFDGPTALGNLAAGIFAKDPKSGSREAQAIYFELAIPLAHKLDAQVALRTDRYSDFGTSTNPKLALRWQPAKSLLLRASAGTGFRAISLPELYSVQRTLVLDSNASDPMRCPVTKLPRDCTPTVAFVLGGNPNLKPETSRQTSVGLIFEPFERASIGVDWWHLTLDHTVGTLGDEQVLNSDGRYEGKYIERGPVDPAFPNLPGPITRLIETSQNLGRQRASGIDVDMRYRTARAAYGQFTMQLSGSYLAAWRTTTEGGGIEESNLNSLPRWQHTLTIEWDLVPWTATLSQSWRAGYEDQREDVNGKLRRVSPYRIWDAQVGYSGFGEWKVTFGVKNLFNTDPPFSNQRTFFQTGYDPSYADPRGRVCYARASYRWR